MIYKIIKNPRITEKATYLKAKGNVYVFNVDPKANKSEIKKAIEQIYKVKPLKIRIVKVKSKRIVFRGREGRKKGGKKAYVFLSKKDKIEI